MANGLAGHSAVALALGALIYLVCLTGTICVFVDELELWEQPAPAPAAFDPASADRLVADALTLSGGPAKAGVVVLRGPTNPRQRTVVSVGRRRWTVDPAGRLIPLHLPWTDFIAELHYDLTAPQPWGEATVGLLGMALLSLLISGVLAHPRILRDAFVLRLGGGRRLREADLHNRMGVWGLPFHVAVTLTGALFGFASLVGFAVAAFGFHGDTGRAAEALGGPQRAADARPAPLPSLSRAIAEAEAAHPDSNLYYLALTAPGTRGETVRTDVTVPGRLPRGDDMTFDAAGRKVSEMRYATGDFGLQLYSGAVQVHVGAFGGLPVRLAYGVLGLALTWICASGTRIWLARRRDRGRPAARLEHAWSACIWGAPVALALATLRTPFGPTVIFWGSLVIALALSQTPLTRGRSQDAVAQAYQLALAALLLVLVAAHLPASLQNGVALAVEAGGLAAAAILAAMALGPPWQVLTGEA